MAKKPISAEDVQGLRKKVVVSLGICILSLIVVGVMEVVMPGSSHHRLLGPLLLMHIGFFIWCRQANPAQLPERFALSGFLACFSFIVLSLHVDISLDSSGLLANGVMQYVMPLALCREAMSTKQGLMFLVVHLARLLQMCREDNWSNLQSLGITVIIDAFAIDMTYAHFELKDARECSNAALNVLVSMLSFMSDGFVVTNDSGVTVVKDQRAALFDLVSQENAFQSQEPGMTTMQLQTLEGERFQVEMYTSSAATSLLQDALPRIFGDDGFKLNQRPTPRTNMVFRCFRILGQAAAHLDRNEILNERESLELEGKAAAGETCNTTNVSAEIAKLDVAAQLGREMSGPRSLPSIPEDAVSQDSSSHCGVNNEEDAGSRGSLGTRVDVVLSFMKAPPNDILAKVDDMESFRKRMRLSRSFMKREIQNLLDQTYLQLQAMCIDRVPGNSEMEATSEES